MDSLNAHVASLAEPSIDSNEAPFPVTEDCWPPKVASSAPREQAPKANPGQFAPAERPSRPPFKRGISSHKRQSSSNSRANTQDLRPRPDPTASRSFEQLQMEQSYLMTSLTAQGQRSTELMRRLSIFLERLADANELPPDERRKTKKQVCLSKSKIAEIMGQEKVILARLGELYVELQSRERWMRVQSERQCFYDNFVMDCPTSSPTTTSAVCGIPEELESNNLTPAIATRLNAKSPEFFPPGQYQSPRSEPSPLSSYLEREDHISLSSADLQCVRDCAGSKDAPTEEPDTRGQCHLTFEFETPELFTRIPAHSQDDLACMENRHHRVRSCERRMSLPSLRCVWPGREGRETEGFEKYCDRDEYEARQA